MQITKRKTFPIVAVMTRVQLLNVTMCREDHVKKRVAEKKREAFKFGAKTRSN